MSTAQKIIKYCAIAFAVFIIASIISGIIRLFWLFGRDDAVGEMKSYSVTEENVETLEVDLSAGQFEIKTGDSFGVESNHKYLRFESSNGLISINEERDAFSFNADGLKVILTVPENFVFKKADISAGAGKVKIDKLAADSLSLGFGAGEAKIDNLTANTSAKIDSGAGELTINGGELADLDFDMGVGEVNLQSRLTGDCDIDYGVGELNMTLIGKSEDYCITLDKGVGEAKMDGSKMHDGETYGTGNTNVKIDGGVGELNIGFRN